MPDDRFFISERLTEGGSSLITEQELHHLQYVMRVGVGETVELVNGRGQLAKASLERFTKKGAELCVQSIREEPETSSSLILAQALPRIPRLEYIIEKATELGVTDFWLFPAEHSERKELSPSQLQRLQQILISSIKQCGRLYLPRITLKPSLFSWKSESISAFYGDTKEGAKPLAQALQERSIDSSIFIVGPEKGFTSKEEDFLSGPYGATGVSLHKNILRVDTAAITGISIISALHCPRRR
ncbi:MAG: RsmE family RNA methyltransferase [Chlamydiae bacterium]|nr:RsmE family RNA methyltransferase [Chlamydiota bacterium]